MMPPVYSFSDPSTERQITIIFYPPHFPSCILAAASHLSNKKARVGIFEIHAASIEAFFQRQASRNCGLEFGLAKSTNWTAKSRFEWCCWFEMKSIKQLSLRHITLNTVMIIRLKYLPS